MSGIQRNSAVVKKTWTVKYDSPGLFKDDRPREPLQFVGIMHSLALLQAVADLDKRT